MTKSANLVTSIKVEINAPASLVWEVLTDLENYPHWNSFCFSARCGMQINDLVEMLTRHPDTGETWPVNEYLVACEPELLLSWEQRPVPENKDAARRDQYVEAIDANRCTYFTTDQFLGINADTIMAEHGAWVKKAFDQVARDLKKRAEALQAERSASHA
ncbi:SRPBCC domain-containing protein [Comamonas fluminis]|uniref:SRPBCC domain-containing protein n=1 Tax=Comamonas fluminis TaxID=2796366 RepID=UPI001C482A39|nr:SRPBCC domain-containing protein [Comamonas fluminis]